MLEKTFLGSIGKMFTNFGVQEKPDLPDLTKNELCTVVHENIQFKTRQLAEQEIIKNHVLDVLREHGDNDVIPAKECLSAINSTFSFVLQKFSNDIGSSTTISDIMMESAPEVLDNLSVTEVNQIANKFENISATPEELMQCEAETTELNKRLNASGTTAATYIPGGITPV